MLKEQGDNKNMQWLARFLELLKRCVYTLLIAVCPVISVGRASESQTEGREFKYHICRYHYFTFNKMQVTYHSHFQRKQFQTVFSRSVKLSVRFVIIDKSFLCKHRLHHVLTGNPSWTKCRWRRFTTVMTNNDVRSLFTEAPNHAIIVNSSVCDHKTPLNRHNPQKSGVFVCKMLPASRLSTILNMSRAPSVHVTILILVTENPVFLDDASRKFS